MGALLAFACVCLLPTDVTKKSPHKLMTGPAHLLYKAVSSDSRSKGHVRHRWGILARPRRNS
jgi:hypothetical protein